MPNGIGWIRKLVGAGLGEEGQLRGGRVLPVRELQADTLARRVAEGFGKDEVDVGEKLARRAETDAVAGQIVECEVGKTERPADLRTERLEDVLRQQRPELADGGGLKRILLCARLRGLLYAADGAEGLCADKQPENLFARVRRVGRERDVELRREAGDRDRYVGRADSGTVVVALMSTVGMTPLLGSKSTVLPSWTRKLR